ncbi:MAG: hypothetical protein M1818_000481 [Claussenomyces sp. TS43310]|nr:MAG: hypothetical protein M1818_000481 [Claussenomyces sp. TS43310]
MLASRISLASHTPVSLLILQATPATSISVFRPTRGDGRSRHQQQSRHFRFSAWLSYLDPDIQKELQRRHRIIKHKYSEALNRKLSWDRPRLAYNARSGLKGFMCSAWRGKDPRPGGRWADLNELRAASYPPPPSNRGIEEVEQSALDKLLGGHERPVADGRATTYNSSLSWTWGDIDLASLKLRKAGRSRTSNYRTQHSSLNDEPSVVESEPDLDYDIDPITNRKIPRRTITSLSENESTDIPVKSFKGYRSQFSNLQPPVSDAENAAYHLNGRPNKDPESPRAKENKNKESCSNAVPTKDQSDAKPTLQTGSVLDPDFPPSRGELKDYRPFRYNEPDGNAPECLDPVTEGLRDYDQKCYAAFRYNEPDGKAPATPDPVASNLREYDSKGYRPFRYNEPDGKAPGSSEPGSMRMHDHVSTPRIDDLAQGGISPAPGLSRGSRIQPASREAPSVIQPSLSRIPPSKSFRFQADETDRREDLDLLRPSDVRAASGILKGNKTASVTEKQSRREALEADYCKSQELETYSDEVAAAEKVKESRRHAQELEIERSELLNHNAHARARVNAKIAELEGEVAEAERGQTPSKIPTKEKFTGNYIRDFPEDFSTSWTTLGSSSNDTLVPKSDAATDAATDAWGYSVSPKGLELSFEREKENQVQSAENDYAADSAARECYSRHPNSSRLQTSLDRRIDNFEERVKAEKDPYSQEPQGLELSYSQECKQNGDPKPTVFVSSYGGLATGRDTRVNNDDTRKILAARKQKDIELIREIRRIYESSYGSIDCNHRQINATSTDQPTAQQVASTLSSSKAGGEARAEQKSSNHQDNIGKAEDVTEAATSESTVYKILAYDSTMQEIKTAETTSIVPDTTSALTPAEVLLRLSNPAKFFPHFQRLQDQGYEIVSGSGDVLVFRKVRDAGPPAAATAASQASAKNTSPEMPEPATGNFASPTGFVNHNVPRPFKSGIDVRREEPVFSGRGTGWHKAEEQQQQQQQQQPPSARKPTRAGKRLLVGAAWVAACSYAVGVVTEFFRTGGIDGKGPTGL